jgi:Ulp1 family protease
MNMVTPLQANGYDCGVYVLAIAELVCRAPPAERGDPPSEAVGAAVQGLTPTDVTAKRREWHELCVRALQLKS